ncbi:MAG: LPS export ABC transporter periplasmic protein LptC [Ignavibacteriae bacterium]|nr:LPS export ABC transporter periplasmic protein LptC [Ignavibacteriota bacterium]
MRSTQLSLLSAHRSLLIAHCFPLLAGLIAVSSLLLTSCEERVRPSISPAGIGRDVPTQESWDATITFTDSGKISAILHAGHIAMFADKKYTLLDSNITVDFFDENEYHTSVLTARRGRVNDITHDFEARENVTVVSDSGTTLKTEELYWTNATQKVHTPAYVEIISPKEQIQGHGFESDQSLNNYTIFRVTGRAITNE